MTHNLLKGKRGIIFGALNSESIAWKVAERCVAEGAQITLSNTPMALRMGELNELSERLNAPIIPADATSVEDLERVFAESVEHFGGPVDFVLHSIGMSPNVRKGRTYDDLDPYYPSSEKAMAPHSSTLAWKIPWTEEPGRLQSMGSLRVGHD